MDDPRQQPQEIRESGEKPEIAEQQKLNDATFEPRSYVEQTGDFKQSESIQNSFVAMVDGARTAEAMISAIAPATPGAADRSGPEASSGEWKNPEQINDVPLPLPMPQSLSGTAQISGLPIPIPRPIDSAQSGLPGEAISATPTTLPGKGSQPASERRDEASALPLPIPGGSSQPAVDVISATPITLPGKGSQPSDEISATPITLPGKGSQPSDDLISATPITLPGKGSQPPDEISATPITLPGKGSAPAVRDDLDLAEPAGGEAGKKDATPINLPDTQRSADQFGVKTPGGLESAVLNLPPDQVAPDSGEAEGSTGGTGQETDQNPPSEKTESDWTPPEMYASIGSDGKIVVVDADGNPLSSPPLITKIVDGKGKEQFIATYPGSGGDVKFNIPGYTGSLQGCSIHVGADGKPTVVNAGGKPLTNQPAVTKLVDGNGKVTYLASYPGAVPDAKTALESYSAPLEGCYIHIGADGKPSVVDSEGKPLASQPQITKFVGGDGKAAYHASYSGEKPDAANALSAYSASLDKCYVHIGADGKPTVVDASGQPLASQPQITKFAGGDGKVTYHASYMDAKPDAKNALSAYSAKLDGCSIHIGADGKPTVVDSGGKPLASQPQITKFVGGDGKATYHASYSGSKPDAANALSLYSASLEGCYAHAGLDGKVTVVDEKGKPLACQPVVMKVPDSKGKMQYFVSYPGDKGSAPKPISWYLPASGGLKTGTDQGAE